MRDDGIEPLFKSAHAALTFAMNNSLQQGGKSALAAMAHPELRGKGGEGSGLGGLDGCGEAGSILRILQSCGPMVEALLTARCAPRNTPCTCGAPCCSKNRDNPVYENAIVFLCKESMAYLAGSFSHYTLRRGIIERYFGSKVKLVELAGKCDVHEVTAGAQNKKLLVWLKGTDRDHPGAEARAWRIFEEKLFESGKL